MSKHIPNIITIIRIALLPLVFLFYLPDFVPYSQYIAIAIFSLGFELHFETATQYDDQVDVRIVGANERCTLFDLLGLAGQQESRQFFELDILENFQFGEFVPGYRESLFFVVVHNSII